jgi:mannobiose 2-epimerase
MTFETHKAKGFPDPSPQTYQRMADDIEAVLHTHVLKKWFPAAIDTIHGGFHQNFRQNWTLIPKNDRGIVYQSRLTWVASQAAMRYPELSTQYKEYSRHGLKYLNQNLWDPDHGGLWWGLDENGVPERHGEKDTYGIAFCIYAASACFRATGSTEALDLAKRAFLWLESHAHDSLSGGYFEALTAEGSPIMEPSNASIPNDFVGTYYGCKSMNTHIHLLEALTALYDIWPDELLCNRLSEIFHIVRAKILTPPGYLNLYFTPEWQPKPDHDSFGHDVETAFLLEEASTALGELDNKRTCDIARQLVDHALEIGWDNEYGGFYDAGSLSGIPINTNKIWWTQAEGLNALALMHAHYRKKTTRYWDALNQQWQFICQFQIDATHGGWYPEVNMDGKTIVEQIKSDRWTEAYHQSRALLLVSEALRRMASDDSRSCE